MLEVPDIPYIRVMVPRGVSMREIARRLHVSRKTVRKDAQRTWWSRRNPG